MTAKDKYLASELLERASEEFANHGCNDFDFPDDWTEQEKADLIQRYHRWNGDPENFSPKHLFLPDYAIMRFLAIELRDQAIKEGQSPEAPSQSPSGQPGAQDSAQRPE